jgi:hypothetical protein
VTPAPQTAVTKSRHGRWKGKHRNSGAEILSQANQGPGLGHDQVRLEAGMAVTHGSQRREQDALGPTNL